MKTTMPYRLRTIQPDDVPSILAIQAEAYPVSMQEHEDVIMSRLHAAHDTSLVAVDRRGICAYLFAYPTVLDRVSPLGGRFCIPLNPDTLYLHDLAISKRSAGNGLGRTLVRVASELATMRMLPHSALVSVQDAYTFWMDLGYVAKHVPDPAHDAALRSYPGQPRYMVKTLIE